MSDLYYDREQTGAKHDILKRYLYPFSYKILRSWESIDFIDGFSGPWENIDTKNLSDTSIGVSLQTLSNVAQELGHSPNSRKIRCIFNEKDPKAYARLDDFIARSRDKFPLVDIKIFHGKFSKNANDIMNAANNRFQLLFVDPTGFTGFSPSILKLFGNNRSSEIIVNFMRSFMERFVVGGHENKQSFLAELVGEVRSDYLINIEASIEDIESEYLKMLRDDLGYNFAGFSPIHNPKKEQIQFHLAFATNHPEGMNTMRHAEFKALSDFDRKRFNKKHPPKNDLFESIGEKLEVRGPYIKIRENHLCCAKDVILKVLLENSNELNFRLLSALVQQDLCLLKTEIKDILVDLTNQGKISDSWKTGQKRKPGDDDLIIFLS